MMDFADDMMDDDCDIEGFPLERNSIKSDGFTYDVPVYQFLCPACDRFFYSDTIGNFCPNCGKRLREEL